MYYCRWFQYIDSEQKYPRQEHRISGTEIVIKLWNILFKLSGLFAMQYLIRKLSFNMYLRK